MFNLLLYRHGADINTTLYSAIFDEIQAVRINRCMSERISERFTGQNKSTTLKQLVMGINSGECWVGLCISSTSHLVVKKIW